MAEKDSLTQSVEETKADYRQLGSCGLRVSVPILGAMSFGDKRWMPWVIEEDEALPLLKAAYDKGLNTWDTANVYSNGTSEAIIGKAIKKYNMQREKLVILSKCYAYVSDDPNVRTVVRQKDMERSKDYINRGGLSRTTIFKAVNASLERLGTDYLDLLQIHRFDYTVPVEETMEALHDLVKAGKVHYIGASSMWTYQFAMMQFCAERHGWTKFVSMQNQYNLLYREEEREMNRYCHLTGVGLIPWAPLCRGHLARPASAFGSTERSSAEAGGDNRFNTGEMEQDKKIIARVEELAQKKGWKMSQVATAWILRNVTSPIIGFSSEERMDEALEVRGKELSEEDVKYLEELYVAREISGHY